MDDAPKADLPSRAQIKRESVVDAAAKEVNRDVRFNQRKGRKYKRGFVVGPFRSSRYQRAKSS